MRTENPGWKPEEKIILRRRGSEDNAKKDLKETGWEGVVLIHVAQDRDRWRALVNTLTNLRVP
jgi:hypothetical protein